MLIETKTIRLRFDDRFTSQLVDHQGGSVWVAQAAGTPPFPLFNFALSEKVDFFDGFEKDLPKGAFEKGDEAARYHAVVLAYFDMKASGAPSWEDSTQDIGGRAAYVRTSRMVMAQYGEEEVFRLFVNIPLDDDFCQEFSAVCWPSQREELEPVFWEIIRTAEFIGDRKEAIRVQEEARAEMYSRVDAALAKADATLAKVGTSSQESAQEPGQTFEPFVPPVDGSSLFRLGDFELEFVEQETSVGTTSFTHQFGFTLVGKVSDPSAALKAKLISEYNDEGEIKFPIYFSGGYGSGAGPEARLEFDQDKCATPYISASIDGLEFGLHYSGLVEIKAGWISLRGRVFCSHAKDQPAFEVEIRRPFDPEGIDWTQYRFVSLSEIEAAPTEVVCHASLGKVDIEAIPMSILRCKELQSLDITSRAGGNSASLKVPASLGELKELTRLSLSGYKLDALPESIGGLDKLESLNLGDCGLSAIPLGVWKLPRLQYLFLGGNRLASVPEDVNLPAMYSLELERNALHSIPESLAVQENLRTIKLEGNPLESLPDVYNDCKVELELSIEDKRRLLDFEYRGADGQGVAAWDEDAFYVRSDPERAATSAKWLAGGDWATYAEALQFLLKRAVGFKELGGEDYGSIGQHRFGGMPDLPPAISYPRFAGEDEDSRDHAYEFIGQVNCESVASLQDYLPRTGLLYFFLTTIHDLYGGNARRTARVIHFDGSKDELRSGKDLHVAADEYYEMTDDAYPAVRVEAAALTSSPQLYGARQNPHLFRGPAASLRDALREVDCFDEDDDLLELFGGGPFGFEMNCYAFTQHEDPEHQVSLHQKGAPEDWTVLLKVGSSGGFMWGDAGDLCYVIHKSDLAKGDFSNVYCTLESS